MAWPELKPARAEAVAQRFTSSIRRSCFLMQCTTGSCGSGQQSQLVGQRSKDGARRAWAHIHPRSARYTGLLDVPPSPPTRSSEPTQHNERACMPSLAVLIACGTAVRRACRTTAKTACLHEVSCVPVPGFAREAWWGVVLAEPALGVIGLTVDVNIEELGRQHTTASCEHGERFATARGGKMTHVGNDGEAFMICKESVLRVCEHN